MNAWTRYEIPLLNELTDAALTRAFLASFVHVNNQRPRAWLTIMELHTVHGQYVVTIYSIAVQLARSTEAVRMEKAPHGICL